MTEPATEPDEPHLAALRGGSEAEFQRLVSTTQPLMMRLAMIYCPDRAVAEEAVQETWIAVIRGLDGFRGQSKLRTWICRIVINVARRQADRESRSSPFSALDLQPDGDQSPSVDPDRFIQSGPWAGHWLSPPNDWARLPEATLLSRELRDVVMTAIADLSEPQRLVVTLRDVEGCSASEVSEILDIPDGTQRVRLHRARSRVRSALEVYLSADPAPDQAASAAC
jgi:RNA polymerase sigma-70 factor (ECF subfamily)